MTHGMPEVSTKGRPRIPPYAPYSTFRNFLDKISRSVPAQIDHSVMPRTSRAIRFQLAAGLRYMGLVGNNGSRTETLLRLSKAQGPDRKRILGDVIRAAYPYLFADFDLGSCTTTQLGQEFARRGASGDTVRKCVAFFVAACKEAGIEVSPHIRPFSEPETVGHRPANPPRPGAGQADEANVGGGNWEGGGSNASTASDWRVSLLLKFPSFDPEWSDEVKAKWFDDFKKLMDLVRDNEQRR